MDKVSSCRSKVLIMSETSTPAVEPTSDPKPVTCVAQHSLTWRAVIIGTITVLLVAVATPFNDWVLNNTYLYCQQLPPVIMLVIILFGLVVNPLLGRRRLKQLRKIFQ